MSMAAMRQPPTAPVTPSPQGARVLNLVQRRLERALAQRVRYRYVRPRVMPHGEGYRIESPCCSRNVDPTGGVIDIALLLPPGATAPDVAAPVPQRPREWSLYARDHRARQWVWQDSSPRTDELMHRLCVDEHRIFWP